MFCIYILPPDAGVPPTNFSWNALVRSTPLEVNALNGISILFQPEVAVVAIARLTVYADSTSTAEIMDKLRLVI